MPGIEELMAMQGGGGGNPMADALKQKLGELMQDPAALQGMQQYMQQMGGGMGGPGAAQAPPTSGPMDMTAGIPPGAEVPGMEPTPGMDIPAGQEQDMVSQEIDRVGATWDGESTPTQSDIDRLRAEPTQTNIDSFDQQFGEGAAEKVLEEEGGDTETPEPPESEY